MAVLARLGALGADGPDGPLFPDRSGGTTTKRDWVAMLERVLTACRVGTHLVTAPKFGGHAARVTGASFLVANGVPLPTVQLLGRRSSMAIFLALAPQAADLALRNSTAAQEGLVAAPPVREAVLRVAGANPRPQAWGEWQAPSGQVEPEVEYREALPRNRAKKQNGQFPRHHAPSHSQGPPL